MRVCILFALACGASAGEWPQFRGPSSSGVGDGAQSPVKWDVPKATNVLWTAEFPGFSVSSPVVGGDGVYVTTAISGDAKQTFRTGLYGDTDSVNDRTPHQWKVLALD